MARLDYSRIDVEQMLLEMGMENVNVEGNEIRYSCPWPGHAHGDKTPSAFMNRETTAFICFTCGARGNAVHFVAFVEGVSPILARRWLRERFQGFRPVGSGGLWQELKATLEGPASKEIVIPAIGTEVLESFGVDWQGAWKAFAIGQDIGPLSYMFERGYAWDTLDRWEFGFDRQTARITFAIRDHDGKLVGFKARSTDGSEPKYRVLGGGTRGFETYDAANILYGADKARAIDGKLIVCEGELNAVMYHQQGFTNATGISGQFLNVRQASQIVSMADVAILVFDDVSKAIIAAKELMKRMRVLIAPDIGTDPAESSISTNVQRLEDASPALGVILGFTAQPTL